MTDFTPTPEAVEAVAMGIPTKPPMDHLMACRFGPTRLYHEQQAELMPKRSGIIKRIVKAPHRSDIRPVDLIRLVHSGAWRMAGNHPRSHPRRTR